MKTRIIASITLLALSGSLRASEETSLTLQVAPNDSVSVELGWAGAEITGVRLQEWTEDIGGILILRGTSGKSRELLLELHDGRLVIRVGEAGGDPGGPVLPPVDPTVPEGHLGLTRQIYGWATTLVDLAADPNRAANALKQAENYDNVADGLVSDPPAWEDVSAAFASLRDYNRNSIPEGPIRDAWAAFSLRVTQRIEGLWPFDSAEASSILRAIGAGLRAVK